MAIGLSWIGGWVTSDGQRGWTTEDGFAASTDGLLHLGDTIAFSRREGTLATVASESGDPVPVDDTVREAWLRRAGPARRTWAWVGAERRLATIDPKVGPTSLWRN